MNNSRKIKVESQKQFDFGTVGKRTPYRIPDGFIEQQEQQLKDKVTMYNVQRKPLHRAWIYAAAASILLLIAAYPVVQLIKSPSATDNAPIYSQTSSVSDDWSDFADADVFLDNMNW